MNSVNLIGALVSQPELVDEWECALQIAVRRLGPAGGPEPGVIYLDVVIHGQPAARAAALALGDRVGIAGRLERDDLLDPRGPRRSRWEVRAHHVDFLDPPSDGDR